MLDDEEQEPVEVLHITERGVRFPVLMADGFGAIDVELEPGQRETIELLNRKRITVIRDYLH